MKMVENNTILYVLLMLFSVYASVEDIKKGSVSRIILWSSIAVTFFYQGLFGGFLGLLYAGIGCIVGLAVFYLAFKISGRRLGLADVWFAGFMGAVLGHLWWYPAVFIACILALVTFLRGGRHSIPFIPYMALGTMIVFPLERWFSMLD